MRALKDGCNKHALPISLYLSSKYARVRPKRGFYQRNFAEEFLFIGCGYPKFPQIKKNYIPSSSMTCKAPRAQIAAPATAARRPVSNSEDKSRLVFPLFFSNNFEVKRIRNSSLYYWWENTWAKEWRSVDSM